MACTVWSEPRPSDVVDQIKAIVKKSEQDAGVA